MSSVSEPPAHHHPAASPKEVQAENDRKIAKIKFFVVLGLLFLNALFSAELFEASFPLIHYLQRFNVFDAAWFLSYRVFYFPVLYILLQPFLSKDKKWAFVRLFQASMSNWIFGVLKLAYAEWRPNYLDPMLASTPYHCDVEYGHPSGHSAGAFCFWFIFADEVTRGVNNRHLRSALQTLIKGTSFVICLTRLYLGAHALNQIFFGMGIGYLCYLLGEMWSKEHLEQIFADTFRRGHHGQHPSIFKGPVFWSWAFFNVLGAVLFYHRVTQELTTEGYFDVIVNCLTVKTDVITKFAVKTFQNCFSSSIFFWSVLGMQTKAPSMISHLYSLQGATWVQFVWRCFLNLLPLPFIGQVSRLRIQNPPLMIFKQLVLLPFVSFLYGRYYGVWNKKIWLYKDDAQAELKRQ